MDTIYLDKSVKNLGHSAILVFECDYGYVSLGKTASCAAPFKSVVIYHAFGITVVDTDVSSFRDIKTDKGKEQHMIQTILLALKPKQFIELLTETMRGGFIRGKAEARAEMRAVLGL